MSGGSLVARLTLQQQALAALVIVVFAISALGLTRVTLYRNETHALEATARRIALTLDLELGEEHDLGRAADSLMVEEPAPSPLIAIRDPGGHLLATNAGVVSGRTSPGSSRDQIHRVEARARCGATIEVSISDRARRTTLAALARALALAALPLFLVSLLLSRWTVRRALRPLEEMARRAGAISLEPGARTLGVWGGLAELERLREAFDRLLVRLGEQLRVERQFASDASHELRTPLTVLSGEIELALADPGSAPATRAGLVRAREELRGMRELIEALLLLRRAGEGGLDAQRVFEPVDLSDTVAAARTEVLEHRPDREADLTVMAEIDVITGGHPVLLTAGVRNLLDNALKFTSPGVPVQVHVEHAGAWAVVRVDDGGSGVAAEDLERVFDPFFRGADARAASGGFGLGLPILRRVARAHGGDVLVERSALGGASFVMRLPRWHRPTPGSAPVQATG